MIVSNTFSLGQVPSVNANGHPSKPRSGKKRRQDQDDKIALAKSNKHPCLQAGDIIDLSVQGDADSAQSSSLAPGPKEILINTPLVAPQAVQVTAPPIASVSALLVTQLPVTDSAVATTVSALLVSPGLAHASAVILPSTVAPVTLVHSPLVASTLATVTRPNVTASESVLPLVPAVATVTVPPVPFPAPTLITPDATASSAPVVAQPEVDAIENANKVAVRKQNVSLFIPCCRVSDTD